jgi:hypothetical protein
MSKQPSILAKKKPTPPIFVYLKQWLGSPKNAFLFLLFVILPFIIFLAAIADYGNSEVYKWVQGKPTDQRRAVFIFECFKSENKKLCDSGINPLEKTTRPGQEKRLEFYPLHGVEFLRQYEPFYFFGFLMVAIFGLARIGNPRFDRRRIATAKQATAQQESALPPEPHPAKDDPKDTWVIGGVIPRQWEADPGKWVLDRSQKIPYCLTTEMLRTGLLIVAPPGSGKTGSVFRPLIEYTRRTGSAAIFWDSKGQDFDASLFDYNFDLEQPENSIKINIYSGETPAQAGERLGEALIPNIGGDKQYFSDVAKDAMSALVAGHFEIFDCYPALSELYMYLSQPDSLENLHEGLANPKRKNVKETFEGLANCRAGLARVRQLLDGKSGDALGTLVNALAPLTTGKITKVLAANPTPGAYTIEELIRRPGLIRLSLPVAESPRIAPIIGRLILAQFNFAVLSPKCNRDIFKLAAVDEAHNFITATIAKGMAQSRSNKAGFALALQTLSQIGEKTLLDTIFANAANKIIMRGVSDEDADKFSRAFGEIELPYVSRSENISITLSTNTGSSKSGGSEFEVFSAGGGKTERRTSVTQSEGKSKGKNSGESASSQTKLRRQFLPSEIINLSTRYAVITTSDAEGRRWQPVIINMDKGLVTMLEQDISDRHLKAVAKLKTKSPAAVKALPTPKTASARRDGKPAPELAQPITPALELPTTPQPRYQPRQNILATIQVVSASASAKPQTEPTPPPAVEVEEHSRPAATVEPDISIKELLIGAGVRPQLVEELSNIITSQNRSIEDVRHLVEEITAAPGVKYKANVIARRIKAADYPPAPGATTSAAQE